MTETEKHLKTLSTLIVDGFFALVDDGETRALAAIEWLMAEIERLTTENSDLKIKIERESTEELTQVNAELAIAGVDNLVEIRRLKHKCNSLWKVINQSTPEHYPAKEDLQWEVIE